MLLETGFTEIRQDSKVVVTLPVRRISASGFLVDFFLSVKIH